MPLFYEFFAGGGMARAGLGDSWDCRFANDFSDMKAAAYSDNWGTDHLVVGDICNLSASDLPGQVDMAWASFPCQDLSLAGNYAGIGREDDNQRTRSGTFWPFWRLMLALSQQGRSPRMIVLENVYGVLTSNSGRDFAAIGSCFAQAGYRFGALLIDAARFVPQSRPRVFIVGLRKDLVAPLELAGQGPHPEWHPPAMLKACGSMDAEAKRAWIWWQLPMPGTMPNSLEELIDDEPEGVRWHTPAETLRLVSMMSERNLKKLEQMKASGHRRIGTVYKRTRRGIQRAELRCDGIAGCLRTPAGGSSRQLIVEVQGKRVRSRLLSAREAARLMGLSPEYILPENYNDAYHLAGDGVAVPVVRHLAASILEPVLEANAGWDTVAVAAE